MKINILANFGHFKIILFPYILGFNTFFPTIWPNFHFIDAQKSADSAKKKRKFLVFLTADRDSTVGKNILKPSIYGKYNIRSSIYNQNEKVILRWEEMTS